MRERVRTGKLYPSGDTDSRAYAVAFNADSDHSRAVGTLLGSGPFSGRWRFGGNERPSLYGTACMESEEIIGWGGR